MLIILRYLFGYVKVYVYGFAPERFLNLVIKNELVLWEIATEEQGFSFYTGRKNLVKMKPYLQKTNMKLKILERKGFPYFLKRNRKRVAFLAGFVLFCSMIYVLSLFIWEVKVTGEDKLVKEDLLNVIETDYVPLGSLKSDVNCSELEDALRERFDEISWISCELKGTCLTVYLEEGMQLKKDKKDNESGDIVAASDAVITKMITRQGTPVAKVTDSVKKGDILISGTIYIYDDNNEIMETSYVRADGDVYGTTKETYEDYVDLEYYEKVYDNNSKSYFTFYVMDYCFTPYIPRVEADNKDVCVEIHKARILKDFYLPVGYKRMEIKPYTLKKAVYTEKQAKKKLEARLSKKIKQLSEKGVEIVENNVTIKKKNGKMIASGTLVKTESIVVRKTSIEK